jgi:hypothetical protein
MGLVMAGKRIARERILITASLIGLALSGTAAHAATTVGSPLPFNGGGAGYTPCGPCTIIPTSIASGQPVSSPIDGVVVRYGAGAGDGPGVFSSVRFRVVRSTGPNAWAGAGGGPTQTTSVSFGNSFFDLKPGVPIRTGDYIGVDTVRNGSNTATTLRSQAGSSYVAVGDAPLSEDGTPRTGLAPKPGVEAFVQATVEPDADLDGYGDETQDGCPTNASTQGACPAANLPATATGPAPAFAAGPDKTPPVLTTLSLSSSVFQAAGSGLAFTARVGTKVSFSLSEPGSVKFTVQRKTKGRRVAGRCRPQTTANRTKRACTRWVNVRGSFTVAAKKGTNKFKFRGRIGGKKLKPARYRLNGRATDKSGNKSALKRKRFRIVK